MGHSLFVRKLALAMAFLVCITTTGFSMNIHFCGGEVQDIAFFSDETECSMMQAARKAPACPMHQEIASTCCDDQDLTLETDSHETFLVKSVQVEHNYFTVLPAPEAAFLLPRSRALLISWTTYRPPPIERDIPVLVQSFLL